MQFSVYHTKPYLQHKIGDCCIIAKDAPTDGRTDVQSENNISANFLRKCGYKEMCNGFSKYLQRLFFMEFSDEALEYVKQ
jgi:hypothetical protein